MNRDTNSHCFRIRSYWPSILRGWQRLYKNQIDNFNYSSTNDELFRPLPSSQNWDMNIFTIKWPFSVSSRADRAVTHEKRFSSLMSIIRRKQHRVSIYISANEAFQIFLSVMDTEYSNGDSSGHGEFNGFEHQRRFFISRSMRWLKYGNCATSFSNEIFVGKLNEPVSGA